MVRIVEICLYYSNYSAKCKNVRTFIDYYRLPINQICVDSEEIRGKLLSTKAIEGVPTITVLYDDSSVEMLKGDKVMLWFQKQVRPSEENIPNEENEKDLYGNEKIEEEDDEEYETFEDDEEISTGKNAKERKMQAIKDIAKQMEAERKKTLGYDEEKLPHY